jgi:hypothetical protein
MFPLVELRFLMAIHTGSSLDITGTVNGANFNGPATFSGADFIRTATEPMTGGFYGANTLADIYQGTDVMGVFWGG